MRIGPGVTLMILPEVLVTGTIFGSGEAGLLFFGIYYI
jgi:hypothetical protein